jgi:hypothetical protein
LPDTLDALTNVNRISAYAPSVARPADGVADSDFWGEDGFSFDDVIDLINPLQHLPVVSTLYRSITGDEISSGAQIAGGGLFGGPIGIFAAAASTMFEEATNGDLINQISTLFDGDGADNGPAAFAMAAGSPETHDRAIGSPYGGSNSTAPVMTASVAEPEPFATLAAETVSKAPEMSPETSDDVPIDGVWLSSIPLVSAPAAEPNPAPGVTTISPATAQLLLQAIGYPTENLASPRAATELYKQGVPTPTDPDAIVDNLL